MTTKRQQLVRNAIAAACRSKSELRLDEVLWFFIEESGGARGFAKLLYDEYIKAPGGGVVRQRIFDMLFRLARFVEDRRPKQADVDTLSEEDLAREADRLVAERLVIADGKETNLADTPDAESGGSRPPG